MKKAFINYGLSARTYTRILKVARTIADLEENEKINTQNMAFLSALATILRFYAKKSPIQHENAKSGICYSSIFYSPMIFANSTISGMAMMVLSRKITSSFQKFNGISLLIIIVPTSVR